MEEISVNTLTRRFIANLIKEQEKFNKTEFTSYDIVLMLQTTILEIQNEQSE